MHTLTQHTTHTGGPRLSVSHAFHAYFVWAVLDDDSGQCLKSGVATGAGRADGLHHEAAVAEANRWAGVLGEKYDTTCTAKVRRVDVPDWEDEPTCAGCGVEWDGDALCFACDA